MLFEWSEKENKYTMFTEVDKVDVIKKLEKEKKKNRNTFGWKMLSKQTKNN
jgi:hypothetical protein